MRPKEAAKNWRLFDTDKTDRAHDDAASALPHTSADSNSKRASVHIVHGSIANRLRAASVARRATHRDTIAFAIRPPSRRPPSILQQLHCGHPPLQLPAGRRGSRRRSLRRRCPGAGGSRRCSSLVVLPTTSPSGLRTLPYAARSPPRTSISLARQHRTGSPGRAPPRAHHRPLLILPSEFSRSQRTRPPSASASPHLPVLYRPPGRLQFQEYSPTPQA